MLNVIGTCRQIFKKIDLKKNPTFFIQSCSALFLLHTVQSNLPHEYVPWILHPTSKAGCTWAGSSNVNLPSTLCFGVWSSRPWPHSTSSAQSRGRVVRCCTATRGPCPPSQCHRYQTQWKGRKLKVLNVMPGKFQSHPRFLIPLHILYIHINN